MREGLSIIENLSKLHINIVPTKIMKYFKDYDKNEQLWEQQYIIKK